MILQNSGRPFEQQKHESGADLSDTSDGDAKAVAGNRITTDEDVEIDRRR